MKTIKKVLERKTQWVIMDEDGKILERFRLKMTATRNLSKHKFNEIKKVHIEEIDVK